MTRRSILARSDTTARRSARVLQPQAQEAQTGAPAPGAVTGLSAEILGRKQEVLRFSKSFLSKVEDLQRRGYAPESAKIRFIVSWKDKDNESEHDVILPDVRFKRTAE